MQVKILKEYLHNMLVLGKIDKRDRYIHKDFVAETPVFNSKISNEYHEKFTKLVVAVFEKIHLEYKACIQQDNMVFMNYIFKGIHARDILKYRATNKACIFDIGVLVKFRNNQIIFEKTFFDMNNVINQLQSDR
ncbi:MAG: hypothetical protein Kow00108_00190 [Calditrichia bacterium]